MMVCTYGPQVCSVQTPTLGIGSKMSEVAVGAPSHQAEEEEEERT
jgi:hypothetical protein